MGKRTKIVKVAQRLAAPCGLGLIVGASPRTTLWSREQHKPGSSPSPGNWAPPPETRLGVGTAAGPGSSGSMAGQAELWRSSLQHHQGRSQQSQEATRESWAVGWVWRVQSGPVKPRSALRALTKTTHMEYILRPCALWDMTHFLLLSISRTMQYYNYDNHIFMMEIYHINDAVIYFHIAKLCMTCGSPLSNLIERELKTFSVSYMFII